MTGAAAELTGKSVADLGRLVKSRKVSPVEITSAFLDRVGALDNKLNTFISIFGERALDHAHHAEREVMAGRYRGPLHGIPFAPKDILATKGLLTTNGSSVTAKWVPDFESTVTQRLGHAGAILFGKLSLAEFAVGTSPAFRTPHNPWALDHITGGSSSGSAAALAADLTPFSIGTDTGGSIRYPSALCGTVGLKPTYGRVSRFGVTTLSWSLDHVGPMARSAADVAIVLQAIAGQDPNDLTSSHVEVPNFAPSLPRGLKGFRVGVPTNYFFDGANPEVERCVRAAIGALSGLGARIVDVTIPHASHAAAAGWVVLNAEAASYHERRLMESGPLFGPTTRGRFESGQRLTAVDYLKAQRLRTILIDEMNAAFTHCDAIAVPTSPLFAAPSGSGDRPPTKPAISTMFIGDMTGNPAITFPCGFSKENPRLPAGLMLYGRPFDESTIIRIAHEYQAKTSWHLERPPL